MPRVIREQGPRSSGPYEVHQSEIKCYLECRQKHHYRYRERVERRRRPNPLIRGTIIHRMVELSRHNKDPMLALKEAEKKYAKLFREEQEEYGDIIGDIRRLMTAYFEWYKRDPIQPVMIKGKPAVELKFKVELAKGIVFGGKIDEVGKSKDGRKWTKDTKSHKTLPKGDINYSDIQTLLYSWAVEKSHGIKVDGVAWDYIRFKAPAVPELLKSTGELSKKNIDTIWPVYLEEIKRHKLDPNDYKDVKAKLEGKEASFFVRSYLPLHPILVTNMLAQVTQVAKEIAEGKPPVRVIGRRCDWCEYYGLCQAEFRGLDDKFIRKADYQEKRDEKDVPIEDVE